MALRGALDFSEVAGAAMLWGLLAIIAFTFARLATVLDVGIGPYHPFRGISHAIENTIVDGCQAGQRALGKRIVSLLSGLLDQFGLLIGIPLLLFLGIRSALQYLWHQITHADVGGKVETVRTTANAALAHANMALDKIESFTKGETHRITSIAKAQGKVAMDYVDTEVGKLRTDTTDAIAKSTTELRALIPAIPEPIVGIGEDVPHILDQAARDAAAKAEAAAKTVTDELGGLLGDLSTADAAALIASVPVLATLVRSIASEAGLDNAECRGKVKQICGTDPAAWGNLLAGLVAGYAIADFQEVVDGCYRLWDELEPEVMEFVGAS